MGKDKVATGKKKKGRALIIKWQHLSFNGRTCPRCSSTEIEIKKAVSILKQSFAPLGIKIIVKKTELPVSVFKKNPLLSNRIWINERLLEHWLGGKVGSSQCCDVCGTSECRTVNLGEETYEVVPARLIIKASLIAASLQL